MYVCKYTPKLIPPRTCLHLPQDSNFWHLTTRSHWTNLPEFQFQADFLLDLEWFSSLLERWSEQINLRFIKPTKGSPITLSREHGERPFNVQAAAGKLRLERPFSFHRHLTSDLGERSWKNESDSDSGSWLVSDSRSRSLLSARGKFPYHVRHLKSSRYWTLNIAIWLFFSRDG